ncbi:MAG: NH(3)-dependent NAD(+) synthetase [Candidatus Uhrbacteria bacterium GW2011_GWE2_45_35]|uniref:NH(3)-dependent NAD(+) synthetase n=1 Tax=Candidatus Uhrbacteria bacterium GW2011_GWE2_45_35 TaxID=1618993 RepID=A0A0G1MGU5_9BACT|nr:MAG: NH(3)-dependent NAD(+) synthetase [Candidatus Uhrbacteria bacterium GW2011_GWE2_45_35]
MRTTEQTITERSLELVAKIGKWIKSELARANCTKAVLGLSGGADSALVAAILQRADIPTTLTTLPCVEGNPELDDSVVDARLVADWLNLPLELVNIRPIYEAYKLVLPKAKKPMTDGNLQSRIRANVLYYQANDADGGALVVGTTNATEMFIGYLTKYGDGAVDIEPIAVFYKGEVYDLLRALGAPQRILEKAPTAGLLPGQTDEDEIGLTYTVMDRVIKLIHEGWNTLANPTACASVMARHQATEHKRHLPPQFEKSADI